VYFASIPECDREMKIDTSKYPPETGITLELCAGIVDKDLPLEKVAKIEVLEECGYDVPVSNLERIISYRYVILVFACCRRHHHHHHHHHLRKRSVKAKTYVRIFFSIPHIY
jgi:8-oxo-dGTP pyrophosphatase MutT (NUDIX family)